MFTGYSITANRGSNKSINQKYPLESEALKAYSDLVSKGYNITLYKVTANKYRIIKSNPVIFNCELSGRYTPEVTPTKSKVRKPKLNPNREKLQRTQWLLY
jgi:hypothetical protein